MELKTLKENFPEVPILCVSATATGRVIKDICHTLNLENAIVLQHSFNRPNLCFNIKLKTASTLKEIKNNLNNINGSAIVYTTTRRNCDDLAQKLRDSGVHCLSYHAGLDISIRNFHQAQWMNNQVKTMIATCAFGLGELL